ncbi:hypothetical protein PsorP6_009101 [Peronosclerospora sorghi]|uniref:Uncharacterized protein n=1 Tax=Peronosclerospora sorghi TaxID=230839 RepID=A0ACC0W2E1_9STRA|nr:hypothetical protein PsorP6_009101 [Peronosclerospora sorghi]
MWISQKGPELQRILQAQQLHESPSVHDHAAGQQSAATYATKRVSPVYARCILDEVTHMDQTFRGLDMSQVETAHDAVSVLSLPKEPRRPSKGTRFFRSLRRAAGISVERAVAAFVDPNGCVTNICKCIPVSPRDGDHHVEFLNPQWYSEDPVW